ncbi:hypothetical protein HDU67_005217 [Dinochytrium kinnereticum]|nr:hypothetical protein HDU67_005217 [Dinochytrium kinnereticum]
MAMDDEELQYFPEYREKLKAGDEEVSWEDEMRDPKMEFGRLRLPGARYFDLDQVRDTLSTMPNALPQPSDFAEHVGQMGISEQDHVVIYDSAGIIVSPRVWWMFKAMGHKKASVLDGGLPKWLKENRPVDSFAPSKDKTASYLPDFDSSIVVDHQEMLVHAVDFMYPDHPVIIDCRPRERYNASEVELVSGLSNGRIPGSVNIDWRRLVTPEGTLSHPLDIIREFKSEGVDLDRDVVCMGHDGVKSAILFLALRVLGKDTGVSLYDGGWIDWAIKKKSPSALF